VKEGKARRSPPGILDRLRFGWLRRAFSIRVDDL
jgi:hypothetical protein